ncbi:Os02g0617150 [Oryza sativa Japonica Group]|uniref:Os02g0617150 protein n=1 Tax=Oryza sativa subsp. japonica TaxID=39947 RepID=C7IYX0_ORYSJ|nr:Os02g0617150 [Oryza sativa Japonica Group]|eukprot:NP_001173079.1 Os02g0617150 [Oryza sativa Japonica Group]
MGEENIDVQLDGSRLNESTKHAKQASVQFGSKNDMSSGASAVTATGQLIPWVKTGKAELGDLPLSF